MFHRKKKKHRSVVAGIERGNKPKPGSIERLHPSQNSHGMNSKAGTPISVFSEQMAKVRSDIARQSHKSALEKAKAIHKKLNTSESESLLVDAYLARIRGMQAKQMVAEAKALAYLVEKRYPSAGNRITELQLVLAAQDGDVKLLVNKLADQQLAPEKRKLVENILKKELIDISSLARCQAVSTEHPLRKEASVLLEAIEAVTSRDVDDSELALPQIPRHSPLAPWKFLVRTIACFYRRQDDACLRLIDKIDSDSAPARLIEPLRAMLDKKHNAELTEKSLYLVKAVKGDDFVLRAALEKLDAAFSKNSHRELFRSIRNTVRICRQRRPELVELLKQHISIKSVSVYLPMDTVMDAMGGSSLHNAYWWRLHANSQESEQVPLYACALWNEFHRNAVHEGLFVENGPETALLYLHMADLLCRGHHDILVSARREFPNEFPGFDIFYEQQPDGVCIAAPPEKQDYYYLYPEKLYERASLIRPDSDIYRQWLGYCMSNRRTDGKAADDVAMKWHSALPSDSEPLLHLVESAEKRKAFSKALKFLETAEQIDGLNPKVKQARLRLLVARTLRHLTGQKTNLAKKDFDEILKLPQAGQGDRPAFLAALQWLSAAIDYNDIEAEKCREQLERLLGSDLAAKLVMINIAKECKLYFAELKVTRKMLKSAQLAQAIGRVCSLGDDMGMEFEIPAECEKQLLKTLKRRDCQLNPDLLASLCEAALRTSWLKLAFAATIVGLKKAGLDDARFMLLRAQSLPTIHYDRRDRCFSAAAELARRQRNMELVAEIVDSSRNIKPGRPDRRPYALGLNINDFSMTDEQLQKVLDAERGERKFPGYFTRYDQKNAAVEVCMCPGCRRKQGEIGPEKKKTKNKSDLGGLLFDDLYDDDEEDVDNYDEFDDDFDEEPFGLDKMPLELMQLLMKLASLNGDRPLEDGDLDRILRKYPEMRQRIRDVMLNSVGSDFDFPNGFSDDFGPMPGIDYPGRSSRSKKEIRTRRKKARRNRKR